MKTHPYKTLFLTFFFTLFSHAGGGWVGNSPLMLASYAHNLKAGELTGSTTRNYFLLPKDETRLALNFSYLKNRNREAVLPGFHFAHGISSRWGLVGPLNFGYGLVNSGGYGHDLLIHAGLNGIGYFTDFGFFTLPSVGLAHSWALNSWLRLTSSYELNTFIKSKKNFHYFTTQRLHSSLGFQLADNIQLRIGATAASLNGKSKIKVNPTAAIEVTSPHDTKISVFTGGSSNFAPSGSFNDELDTTLIGVGFSFKF